MPSKSIAHRLDRCATPARGTAPRARPTAISGTLIRNTEPHAKWSSSQPPRIGPSGMPSALAITQTAIAFARAPPAEHDGQHGQRQRHQERRADAEHDARGDQLARRPGEGARQRGQPEHHERTEQQALRAEPVAQQPRRQQRARPAPACRRSRTTAAGWSWPQVHRQRRHGDGQHRRVEPDRQGPQSQRAQRPPPAWMTVPPIDVTRNESNSHFLGSHSVMDLHGRTTLWCHRGVPRYRRLFSVPGVPSTMLLMVLARIPSAGAA